MKGRNGDEEYRFNSFAEHCPWLDRKKFGDYEEWACLAIGNGCHYQNCAVWFWLGQLDTRKD